MDERCVCTHAEEEHEDSWRAPCEVDGCDCPGFEAEDR